MSASEVKVRLLVAGDEEWVNGVYQKINFLPSKFEQELIVIAEVNGERIGVGRLAPVGEKMLELGGMYVDELFRGTGVASRIIRQLIAEAEGHELFCIPFESKLPLYFVQGFVPFEGDFKALPPKLKAKFYHCATTFEERMHLLVHKSG